MGRYAAPDEARSITDHSNVARAAEVADVQMFVAGFDGPSPLVFTAPDAGDALLPVWISGAREDATPKSPLRGNRQTLREEARQTVSRFCEHYHGTRVEPTVSELESLWQACRCFDPRDVSSAIYDQLSWTDGRLEWQPRLRALILVEHLFSQGGTAGCDIAAHVVGDAEELLDHLAAEVPQCRELAYELMSLAEMVQSEVLRESTLDPPDLDGHPSIQGKMYSTETEELFLGKFFQNTILTRACTQPRKVSTNIDYVEQQATSL